MLLSPETRIAASALALLLAGTAGWKLRDADYQRHLRHDAQAQASAQVKVRQQEASHENTSQQVREQNTARQAQVQVVYRTITKEIPVYVTRTKIAQGVAAAGGLPAGFVWNYNRAASASEVPFPADLDPDTPTGVDLSALAETTAGNFALYHACKTDLQSWYDWYNLHSATWADALKEGAPKQ